MLEIGVAKATQAGCSGKGLFSRHMAVLLTEEEIAQKLPGGWERQGTEITRPLKFVGFRAGRGNQSLRIVASPAANFTGFS
jgi:hypothetical protein